MRTLTAHSLAWLASISLYCAPAHARSFEATEDLRERTADDFRIGLALGWLYLSPFGDVRQPDATDDEFVGGWGIRFELPTLELSDLWQIAPFGSVVHDGLNEAAYKPLRAGTPDMRFWEAGLAVRAFLLRAGGLRAGLSVAGSYASMSIVGRETFSPAAGYSQNREATVRSHTGLTLSLGAELRYDFAIIPTSRGSANLFGLFAHVGWAQRFWNDYDAHATWRDLPTEGLLAGEELDLSHMQIIVGLVASGSILK